MIDLAQTLSGFIVGVLVGLTGVGGGSLMTPILIMLFGIHPLTAVGTDLMHAAITKSGATYVHATKNRVDWRITKLLAVGSLPAAVITILSLHSLSGSLGSSKIVTSALGLMLILTGLALVLRTRMKRLSEASGDIDRHRHPGFTIATGVILGISVSLTSVGAGALGITALICLYPRLAAQRMIASDLAHAVPLTLVAGLGRWFCGDVDWRLLISLLLGSLPGIFLGSHLVGTVPERILRFFLIAILLTIGVRVLIF